MGQERPQKREVFGFSEQEQLWDRVSHERFMALVTDEQTRVHEAQLSTNLYGEFLFVTVSSPTEATRVGLTFYGAGYHEQRERWITDTWAWYETPLSGNREKQVMQKADVTKLIQERMAEIAPYAQETTQTARGRLFEMLADLTDEDGALAEIDDLADFADLFNDDLT